MWGVLSVYEGLYSTTGSYTAAVDLCSCASDKRTLLKDLCDSRWESVWSLAFIPGKVQAASREFNSDALLRKAFM